MDSNGAGRCRNNGQRSWKDNHFPKWSPFCDNTPNRTRKSLIRFRWSGHYDH